MEEVEENMRVNRGFKGIWIPKEIWLNPDLTMQEKVFLVEIDSLDNEEGCTAGNQYFAEFFGISKTRVSLVIQNLISKGYITSRLVYKEGSKQILYRVLNICRPPYPTFVIEGIQQKLKGGIQQKLKDNNTNNNNTNNNTNNKKVSKKESFDDLIDSYTENEDLREELKNHLATRKTKKATLTNRAIELSLKKLDELVYHKPVNDQEQEKIKIVQQSIERGWTGFFEVKENTQKQYKKNDGWDYLNEEINRIRNNDKPF